MSVADHILHQEPRIVRQRELIAKLESRGDCAAALCQARGVLEDFERDLAAAISRLTLILDAIGVAA